MTNEYARTDGEGERTDSGTSVASDRGLTDDDLDALFEALADAHRRCILDYLTEHDVAAVSDLVEHVADSSASGTADDPDRVAMRLHHAHLPKLADADLVEHDTRSETVRYRGDPPVSEWLSFARSHESDAT